MQTLKVNTFLLKGQGEETAPQTKKERSTSRLGARTPNHAWGFRRWNVWIFLIAMASSTIGGGYPGKPAWAEAGAEEVAAPPGSRNGLQLEELERKLWGLGEVTKRPAGQ